MNCCATIYILFIEQVNVIFFLLKETFFMINHCNKQRGISNSDHKLEPEKNSGLGATPDLLRLS